MRSSCLIDLLLWGLEAFVSIVVTTVVNGSFAGATVRSSNCYRPYDANDAFAEPSVVQYMTTSIVHREAPRFYCEKGFHTCERSRCSFTHCYMGIVGGCDPTTDTETLLRSLNLAFSNF